MLVTKLQSSYILVLTWTHRIVGDISEKNRGVCLQIICLLFPIMYILSYSGVFHSTPLDSMLSKGIIGTILLITVTIISVNKPLVFVSWRRSLIIPMQLCGIGLVITSCLHSVGDGFMLFGLDLIFIFPAVIFVWNNRGDYWRLYDAVARAFVICSCGYFFLCLVLAFHGGFAMYGGRWAGTMENVNFLSLYGANSFLATIYLIVRYENSRRIWLYSCVAGISIGFVILGASRVSFLICITGLGASLLFSFIRKHKGERGNAKVIVKGSTVAGVIIAFAILSSVGLSGIQQFSEVGLEQSNDTHSLSQRFDVTNYSSANEFTSGRVELWKRYAKHLNLLGHDYDHTDWNELTGGQNIGAHNIFLGVGYRCGVSVALVFVFVELVAGVLAIGLLFDRKASGTEYLFFILFFINYFFESMLDVAVIPFPRNTVLLFYLGLICVMSKRNSKQSLNRTDQQHLMVTSK